MNYFPVVSGQESLALDSRVINEVGIRSIVLMEKAADAVIGGMSHFFNHDEKIFSPKTKFAIVCGTGNNGADGAAIARNLVSRGGISSVDVFLVSLGEFIFKFDEGKENLRILLDENFMHGLKVIEWTPDSSPPLLSNYDIVVDALFGAGFKLTSQPNQFTESVLAQLAFHKSIVAVDVPSGQCPTTGQSLLTHPIHAALTVTFGAIKSGLVTYPGKSRSGKIYFSPISFPPKISQTSSCRLIFPIRLPPRDPDGHKSVFGKGLFVSGSKSYFGAPLFCAGSFLRCGGGYARLASLDAEQVYPVVASKMPEIVFLENFEDNLWDSDVVVIGPGLGRSARSVSTVRSVLTMLAASRTTKPDSVISAVIIDGDGLGLLLPAFDNDSDQVVKIFSDIMKTNCSVILTPHLGELRTLFWSGIGKSTFPHSIKLSDLSGLAASKTSVCFLDYVYSTKRALVDLVDKLPNLVVVVKGSSTCVVDGKSHAIRMNVTGNSGMGTAGSGDVLCGVIANIVERNSWDGNAELIDAVATAVWVHGRAGDLAREKFGEEGMIASDIMNELPIAIREVSLKETHKWTTYYPTVL